MRGLVLFDARSGALFGALLAGLTLSGCATLDAVEAPKPVGEITPQPGEHPCVEFDEDMYGRTYCRKQAP